MANSKKLNDASLPRSSGKAPPPSWRWSLRVPSIPASLMVRGTRIFGGRGESSICSTRGSGRYVLFDVPTLLCLSPRTSALRRRERSMNPDPADSRTWPTRHGQPCPRARPIVRPSPAPSGRAAPPATPDHRREAGRCQFWRASRRIDDRPFKHPKSELSILREIRLSSRWSFRASLLRSSLDTTPPSPHCRRPCGLRAGS